MRKLITKNPYFLAPMHNINDIVFRKLCKKAGAGLCWTELVNPESKKPIDLSDHPVVQLVCNQTKGIKEFIKKHDKNIVMYDFNLGCPSPHAKQSKVGWYMHKDFEKIKEILKEIRKHTKKPICIKIRKLDPKATKEILKIAEEYCDIIAIHPRTCKQGYSGTPDIKYALKIKKQTNLPIIFSGNITNKKQADNILKQFDYIMIGRKAIGNPNIFGDLTNNKSNITFDDYLKQAKKHHIDFNQIKRQAMTFTKGQRNSSKKREKIVFAKSINEIKKILSL